MAITKKAKKTVSYKFSPPTREIQVIQTKMLEVKQQKQVTRLVLRGKSWAQIAEAMGITEDEAYAISKSVIKRWATDLATSAPEAKEVDLRRLDSMLDAIHDRVFPEPYIDNETGLTVQPPPDPVYTKLYLEIIDRRRALLGTDAAKKLDVAGEINVIKREYIGGNPDDL